jgi:hypothetical protein
MARLKSHRKEKRGGALPESLLADAAETLGESVNSKG